MAKINIKQGLLNILGSMKNEIRTPNADFKSITIKCVALYLCLFLSVIHFSFVFVTVAIAGIFILTEKSSRCVYYMIFLLPFLNIIRKTSDGLYYSIALWCLVLAILGLKLFVSVFIKKDKKLNWPFTIAIAILLIYITVIGPLDFTTHGAAYMTIAICYVLYYYLKDFSFKEIVFIFFLGAVAASILGFFRPLFERASQIIPYFNDAGGRFSGVSNDPNYYAGDMLMILAGAMILFDRNQIKYLFYVGMIPLTVFAIMSLSKMMLVIYAGLMVIFCIYILIKNRWKNGFIKCCAIGLSFIISCVICIKPIMSITGRFLRDDSDVKEELLIPTLDESGNNSLTLYEFKNNALTVLTTGRTNIWISYIEESFSSVKYALFGHGVGAEFIFCDNGFKVDYFAEHNTFVQMIYRLGVLGILIIAIAVLLAARKKNLKGLNLVNLLVAFVVFGLFMSLCNLLSYRLSIYLLILILSLCYRGEENQNEVFVEKTSLFELVENEEKKYLSVIIPVKNGGEFIEDCLNSVLNNSGLGEDELEVVVVNDHSEDDTVERVKALVKNNSNIMLVDSVGSGVSEARNTGINYATGKYVIFFDADDYVDENFKSAIEDVKKSNADLFLFEFDYEFDGNLKKMVDYPINICGEVIKHGSKEFLELCKNCNNGPVNKLVNRHFLISNNLQFKKYSIAEDLEWSVRVFLNAGTVMVSKTSFYHYVKHEKSAMNTSNLKKTVDAINACKEAVYVINNFDGIRVEQRALKKIVANTQISTLQYYKGLSKQDKIEFKKQLENYENWLGCPAKFKLLILRLFILFFGIDLTLKLI